MLVEIDTRTWTISAAGGKRIVGTCAICGRCCEKFRPECAAENLEPQTSDGVPIKRCRLQGPLKPVSCAVWPFPDSELPEGCSLSWE